MFATVQPYAPVSMVLQRSSMPSGLRGAPPRSACNPTTLTGNAGWLPSHSWLGLLFWGTMSSGDLDTALSKAYHAGSASPGRRTGAMHARRISVLCTWSSERRRRHRLGFSRPSVHRWSRKMQGVPGCVSMYA